MSHRWQSGDFDRKRLRGAVRHFAPAHAAESLPAIDLQRLYDRGKRLILLDVDHTLVQWKAEEFAPEVVAWVEKAKAMGFGLCIISNTHRLERLERLEDEARRRDRAGPLQAQHGDVPAGPHQVQPQARGGGHGRRPDDDRHPRREPRGDRRDLGAEDGREGVQRDADRQPDHRAVPDRERSIEALVTPVDEDRRPRATARTLGNQLVRFAIVGGTSFVIDYCVKMTLTFAIPYGGSTLGRGRGPGLASGLPFALRGFEKPHQGVLALAVRRRRGRSAMVNSFVLEPPLDLRDPGQGGAEGAASPLPGDLPHRGRAERGHLVLRQPSVDRRGEEDARIATVVATLIVAVWNFAAQRLYAFRATKTMNTVYPWREAPQAQFAVIGDPVDHSRSPAMHEAAYAALGLPYQVRRGPRASR